MERRQGIRKPTDFSVELLRAETKLAFRCVELGSTGLVLEGRSEGLSESLFCRLDLSLPERGHSLSLLARPVRLSQSRVALRFVQVSDVDRLELAEHLDQLSWGEAGSSTSLRGVVN